MGLLVSEKESLHRNVVRTHYQLLNWAKSWLVWTHTPILLHQIVNRENGSRRKKQIENWWSVLIIVIEFPSLTQANCANRRWYVDNSSLSVCMSDLSSRVIYPPPDKEERASASVGEWVPLHKFTLNREEIAHIRKCGYYSLFIYLRPEEGRRTWL